jgi:thioredoxin 1
MSHESGILELNEANFDSAVSEGLTLVDFWAPWCGPCRMQGPVLAEVAGELDGQVRVGKVNVDDSPRLAGRFRVQAIPLLVLLDGGREVGRLVGLQSKADLLAAIGQAA